MHQLKVHLSYDSDDKCWFVSSSEIPGLFLEDKTPERLLERLIIAAPEMLALNAHLVALSLKISAGDPVGMLPVFAEGIKV